MRRVIIDILSWEDIQSPARKFPMRFSWDSRSTPIRKEILLVSRESQTSCVSGESHESPIWFSWAFNETLMMRHSWDFCRFHTSLIGVSQINSGCRPGKVQLPLVETEEMNPIEQPCASDTLGHLLVSFGGSGVLAQITMWRAVHTSPRLSR